MTPTNPSGAPIDSAGDETIAALYRHLLDCWNERDASAFAACFADDGYSIGFDGSQMAGRAEIAATLGQIFADHATARYVSKIREICQLAPDIALVRAVVGMVPRGQSDINPAVNTIQTVVAARRDGEWRIAQLQNTPAQFHGRPDLSEALTQELHHLL
jgi:uncharacterized protein (TIGR02246 family)